MKNDSALRKDKILPFVVAQMDLEDIMLSEISQRKIDTIWFYLYVESQKTKQMNKQTNKQTAETDP